jgi:hypothetical protein
MSSNPFVESDEETKKYRDGSLYGFSNAVIVPKIDDAKRSNSESSGYSGRLDGVMAFNVIEGYGTENQKITKVSEKAAELLKQAAMSGKPISYEKAEELASGTTAKIKPTVDRKSKKEAASKDKQVDFHNSKEIKEVEANATPAAIVTAIAGTAPSQKEPLQRIKVQIQGSFGKLSVVYQKAFRHNDSLILFQYDEEGLFYEPPSDLQNPLKVTLGDMSFDCYPIVYAPFPDGKVALTVFLIDERG